MALAKSYTSRMSVTWSTNSLRERSQSLWHFYIIKSRADSLLEINTNTSSGRLDWQDLDSGGIVWIFSEATLGSVKGKVSGGRATFEHDLHENENTHISSQRNGRSNLGAIETDAVIIDDEKLVAEQQYVKIDKAAAGESGWAGGAGSARQAAAGPVRVAAP